MNFELLKKRALERGISELEVYESKSSGLSISSFDGEVDGNKTELSDAICIRGVYNNQLANVYTENNTDIEIDSILDNLVENATLMSKSEPYFIYEGDKKYPAEVKVETNFEEAPIASKLSLLTDLEKLLRQNEYVYKTEMEYGEEAGYVSIKNTKGLDVSRNNKQAYISCELVAKKGDDTKVSYDYVLINKMEDVNLKEFADKLVNNAVSKFNADSIPSKNYDVVFDKKVVRSLLGAYSSLFSAENVIKKMSLLQDKLGEKVFGDNINIINDPLNPNSYNTATFDDEGVATKKTVLVENGVLKSYLHNLSTASIMNTKSTGNGFKQSVESAVRVSPFNMYLEPQDKSLDDLFKLVNNGVYITDVTGLHAGVNQISGAYSLQSSGFMIRDGKKCEAVTLIIVSSNFIETLSNVMAIGNDLEFRGTIGAPSIAVKNISISGK